MSVLPMSMTKFILQRSGIEKNRHLFFGFLFVYPNFEIIFAPALGHGTLAQLVEQRTENPCVPGSIPGGTT